MLYSLRTISNISIKGMYKYSMQRVRDVTPHCGSLALNSVCVLVETAVVQSQSSLISSQHVQTSKLTEI